MNKVVDLSGKPVKPSEQPASVQNDYDLPYTLSQLEAGLAQLCFIAEQRPSLFMDLKIRIGTIGQCDAVQLLRVARNHIDYIERRISPPAPEVPLSAPCPRRRNLLRMLRAWTKGGKA